MRTLNALMILLALCAGSTSAFAGGVHCKPDQEPDGKCLPLNAFALVPGGVFCKECPAESDKCMPRPDCDEQTGTSYFESTGVVKASPWMGPEQNVVGSAQFVCEENARKTCKQLVARRLTDFTIDTLPLPNCHGLCKTVRAKAFFTCE